MIRERIGQLTSSLVSVAGSPSRGAGLGGSAQQGSQRSSSPALVSQLPGLAGRPLGPPSGSAGGELTVTGTGSPLSAVGGDSAARKASWAGSASLAAADEDCLGAASLPLPVGADRLMVRTSRANTNECSLHDLNIVNVIP